jgi:hypothetical protein
VDLDADGLEGGERQIVRYDNEDLVNLALDVKVNLTPPCIILHKKYAGWRENDFNVYD